MTVILDRHAEQQYFATIEATEPIEVPFADTTPRDDTNLWATWVLLATGLVLAILNLGVFSNILATLALGTAAALMVIDPDLPTEHRHERFARSGR